MSPALHRSTRVKSLELQGYKTFAHKTVFAFAPSITVIVGPNGSGKSNIADAIRWVLGEQSFTVLRAKRTEDLIFSGSDSRPRAGMASATIVFDNSDGWLPIDFSEVTISRRAYRDGQNEYLINGQRVRLREVAELLGKTGLARRTYTIIGQGLVDEALSLKAEQRRLLFEEAAGIGIYRSRRREALRRLDATRRNLERVQDILAELKPRLRSIKRQAKRAQRYHQVRQDLMEGLRVWHGYHWHQLNRVVSELRERRREKGLSLAELRRQQETTEKDLGDARWRIDELRSSLHGASRHISALYAEREVHGRRLAVVEERSRWLKEQEELIKTEISSLEVRKQDLGQRLKEAKQELQARQERLEGAEATEQELRSEGKLGRAEMKKLQARGLELRRELEKLTAQQAAWETKMAQLDQRQEELEARGEELGAQVSEAQSAVEQAESQLRAAAEALDKAKQARSSAEKGDQTAEEALAEAEAVLKRYHEELAGLQSKHGTKKAELEALDLLPHLAQRASEQLAAAAGRGDIDGLVGAFSSALRAKQHHKKAIAAALGDVDSGQAFRSLDDVAKALKWLEAHAEGERAVLAPISGLRKVTPLPPFDDPACLGNAASLVRAESPYQELVELLLARILVVEDREAALRLVGDLPPDGKLVTLAGEVFHGTGLVVVGAGAASGDFRAIQDRLHEEIARAAGAVEKAEARSAESSTSLARAKENRQAARRSMESASKSEGEAQIQLESSTLALDSAKGRHGFLKAQWDGLQAEIAKLVEMRTALSGEKGTFAKQRDRAEADLQRLQTELELRGGSAQITQTEARFQVARDATQHARDSIHELEERQLTALDQELSEWRKRLEANQKESDSQQGELAEAQQQVKAIESQLEDLNTQLDPTESNLAQEEEKRTQLEANDSRTRSELQAAERAYSQDQIELARREEELISLRRRIIDDFGLVSFEDEPGISSQEPLPLEGLVERLPRVKQLPLDIDNHLSRLRAQLRRIGPVNPEAQKEHREVSQRVTHLTDQMDDLKKAESKIHEVVAELDLLMEREFRKTFDAVAVSFREAFKRLFGGGSAKLVLNDTGDLDTTGIDIQARLPGRREQGLAMLSGGERSLTACALIFALLDVSPTPFCVLDEVDAMLDEVNVVRFTDMLTELSQDTQFVVITHNRQTVQQADVVYGVSMGPESISKVISLKLEGAEQEAAD
ncbi:MAG: chromosome segregation protein SMC [Anaerolineales bacterium]